MFWKGAQLTWLSSDRDVGRDVAVGGEVLGATIWPGDSGVTALITSTGQLEEVDVTSRGRIVARRALGGTNDPVEAVRVDMAWVVADRPDSMSWRLRRLDRRADVLFQAVRDAGREPASSWMRLSEGKPGHVFVTRRLWPFDVHEVDITAAVPVKRLALPAMTPEARNLGLERQWVSLPVLPVECGSIQLLSDRRSDRRLMILRDQSGTVIRSRLFTAPIGFVQSRLANRVLVAVRALEGEEVVSYRWNVRK